MPITDILTQHEIDQFKVDGAVFLKGKFSSQWIEELTHGIDANMKHPSPRFARHTKDDDALGILKTFGFGTAIKALRTLSFNRLLQKLQLSY